MADPEPIPKAAVPPAVAVAGQVGRPPAAAVRAGACRRQPALSAAVNLPLGVLVITLKMVLRT